MSSKRKILFLGETITIVQHSAPSFLEMIFYGYTNKDEFQKAWQQLYDIVQKSTASRLVLDQKYMHVQPESFDWFREVFVQSVEPLSGNLHVAIIPAVNFLGEYQVKQDVTYLLGICSNIEIQFFENFDLAESWMLKQN